jgi:Heterokaryon incompatibility protein (HET)
VYCYHASVNSSFSRQRLLDMTKYSYVPLVEGHFRLLKLFPGESEAQLEGNLLIRMLRPRFTLTRIETPSTSALVSDGEASVPAIKTNNEAFEPSPEAVPILPFAEEYDVLSYTWGGEPDNSLSISVIDQNQSCRISLTSNLEAALRHLRYPSNPRFLWRRCTLYQSKRRYREG